MPQHCTIHDCLYDCITHLLSQCTRVRMQHHYNAIIITQPYTIAMHTLEQHLMTALRLTVESSSTCNLTKFMTDSGSTVIILLLHFNRVRLTSLPSSSGNCTRRLRSRFKYVILVKPLLLLLLLLYSIIDTQTDMVVSKTCKALSFASVCLSNTLSTYCARQHSDYV
jgi:hypothetical protein